MAEELRFHSGHTWVRSIGPSPAFAGATGFAMDFLGTPERIVLPRENHRVKVGERVWTIISKQGRKLTQVSPLTGRILVTNTTLAGCPEVFPACRHPDPSSGFLN